MPMLRKYFKTLFILSSLLLLVLFTAACAVAQTPGVLPGGTEPTLTITPEPVQLTNTPVPTPTNTPEPLALRVNGEDVTLAVFEADLRQLEEAHQLLNKTVAVEEQRNLVLDHFTETILLAQGAAEAGYLVDDAALQAEIDRLGASMGGWQGLQDWFTQRGYTEAAFRAALSQQMSAAWQRDQIAAGVPIDGEQVHVRQILTQDEDIAKRAYEQVRQAGVNFAAQAYRYDPITGGDLGWFPRGYLLQIEVEEAAFLLQPGEISPVTESAVGYHIVQLIAREPARLLSPDARRVLQHKAIQEWLKSRRESSAIEVLLP
jgi:peptidyl-prolyl cis-trans isomerase C